MKRLPRRRARCVLLASATTLLALGLAGCSGGRAGEPESARNPAPVEERLQERELKRGLPERVVTTPTGGEYELPPEPLLDAVLADASSRSGVEKASLAVAASWRRTWNDGSLGCPAPDAFYTQALVPGWQVMVTAGEATLDYRLADNGHFLLCTPGKPTPRQDR